MRKILISCFGILLFCFAQACAFDLPLISKSKIRVIAQPGQTIYGDMTVENQSDKKATYKLYLNDWYYLPAADGTKEFVPARTTGLSCASWITFSPAELEMAPFSKKSVRYSVKIPKEAKGGYFAALFFETLLGSVAEGSDRLQAGMNIALRVATLFYVEAKGTTERSASIAGISFENAKGKEPYNFKLTLDFVNTGNVDITAGGTFHIINDKGLVLARDEFSNIYTFPGGKARLVAQSRAKVPKGRYNLVLTVDLGKALEEAQLGRGPVVTKEAMIEFGENSSILRIGELQ